MPNTKKRLPAVTARSRTLKMYWLPMPRREADTIILQYRIALERIRNRQAGQVDAQCIAHAVVLTGMLTELGYGKLALPHVRGAEDDALAMLERGAATDVWIFPATGIGRLIDVVNEHDRLLREVHLAALIACNERLQEVTDSVMHSGGARGD